mmetsp:Transcript_4296/g.9677  ORF Transcript_4296/g.9677 Transcript_4296/m.9677 type:complete len:244 (+) Transcript_4296:1145-1876(+)
MEEGAEAETLEEMIAAANAVERRARQSSKRQVSRRDDKRGGKEAPSDCAALSMVPAEELSNGDVRKSSSLANIWPWKSQSGRGSTAVRTVDGDKGDNSIDKADGETDAKQSQMEPPKLPKSDPAKIVLARVRFLLENEEEGILPPYHVFNSNSECIAVWVKTGRWSSLQSDVFWHTTAIGNAKSSTLMGLTLAATQPWLIPALPIAAVAAVGATRGLTDKFWAQAEPYVFVEAIENWSGLTKL